MKVVRVASPTTQSRQTKWKINGAPPGWAADHIFPTKWKAKKAVEIVLRGGDYREYCEITRQAKTERKQAVRKRQRQEMHDLHAKVDLSHFDESNATVTISRQPGSIRVTVPLNKLNGARIDRKSGGIQQDIQRDGLWAYIWCDELPQGEAFNHSCLHGKGPHRIKVYIPKTKNNSAVFEFLRLQAMKQSSTRRARRCGCPPFT